MFYDITKVAHILSLFVWVGGMVAVALALRYPAKIHLQPLKAYDRAVTTPAMILALSFGILLAVQGDWFTSVWLGQKILTVLALAGLHGALVGKLRRAALDNDVESEPSGLWFLLTGFVLVALIIFFATVKP